MTGERTLALLAELVRADEAHSTVLAELDGLARDTVAVGVRSDGLAAALEAAPAERQRLAAALAEAEAEREERAQALTAAEVELRAAEAARDRERVAAARRSQVRARDALSMTDKRVASGQATLDEHERRIEAARRDVRTIEERAAEIAAALRGRPRVAEEAGLPPASGLSAVSRWASGARAALFVARGSVAAEREAVIRQANELASAALGEPLAASSAALVARRVEQALSQPA